jgi:hypothetical protein
MHHIHNILTFRATTATNAKCTVYRYRHKYDFPVDRVIRVLYGMLLYPYCTVLYLISILNIINEKRCNSFYALTLSSRPGIVPVVEDCV